MGINVDILISKLTKGVEIVKIFIDQGHNPKGADTGAAYNNLKEQDVTFKIGKLLSEKLKLAGVEVKLSRNIESDSIGFSLNDSLKKRADMANAFNADLFISIHCNASLNPNASGTESYVYSANSKAYSLADKITKSICNRLNTKTRGVKSANFAVLRYTKMPAILIETAFISNSSDAGKLRDRAEDFAEAIYSAIADTYALNQEPQGAESAKYSIIGTTHVIEIDPRNIWAVETQCKTDKVTYNNFVNSVFFMNLKNGNTHPQGIIINAGKVIANNPTHGKPVATLVIYGKDNVQLKYIDDITKEKDVWFAVSGYGIYPEITAEEEGFTGKFSDVTRATSRPIIGYRKKDNKIVVAVRENSNAERARQTAKNLGLDFAISLDGGGSTTLKINGKYKFKGDGRKIFGGIIWN